MRIFFLLPLVFLSISCFAQSKKILFIGNSYTGWNSLPTLFHDIALNTGDTLNVDWHTPGGATMMNHANNPIVMAKLESEIWDFVILQSQSQEPAFPLPQVQSQVFPYAKLLCDSIRGKNPCSQPVFYMTWGRENGDQQNCPVWPPVCTYEGMDSLLNLRYQMMGNDNNAFISPVGAVWRYIRENYPDIDLYANDGSHPSQAGSYAAACTFYSILLRKDPINITFDYTLSPADAAIIRLATQKVAYEELLSWNVGIFDPEADFSYTLDNNVVSFMNESSIADSITWYFGDGQSSILSNPVHTYDKDSTYNVMLLASYCGQTDTLVVSITVGMVSTNLQDLNVDSDIAVYPNPFTDSIFIQNDAPLRHIRLIDINGNTVWAKGGSPPSELNLKFLAPGIYILEVKDRTGHVQYVKLVRQQ